MPSTRGRSRQTPRWLRAHGLASRSLRSFQPHVPIGAAGAVVEAGAERRERDAVVLINGGAAARRRAERAREPCRNLRALRRATARAGRTLRPCQLRELRPSPAAGRGQVGHGRLAEVSQHVREEVGAHRRRPGVEGHEDVADRRGGVGARGAARHAPVAQRNDHGIGQVLVA